MIWKMLPQGLNLAKSCVGVICWIIQHTVQKRQRVACIFNPFDRFGDLMQISRSGGKEDGFLIAAENTDKGLIGDIRGRDFEDIHQIIEKGR